MRVVKYDRPVQAKAKKLTQKWYKPLINTYEVVCICFYAEWFQGKGEGNFEIEYDKAANIIHTLYPRERHGKGKAIMVKVNCNDERVLANMFNIGAYPWYIIIKNGERMEVPYPKWRSTEYFLQFIEAFIDDKRTRLSPEPDRSILPIGICSEKITLQNYKTYVKKHDIVLVFFYATWYQSCRDALESFEKAYVEVSKLYLTRYSSVKPPEIGFARMEAGLNGDVIKKFKIRKYPTFKLFKSGAMWGEYQCDGTVEGFVNFVRTHEEEVKKENRKLDKDKDLS